MSRPSSPTPGSRSPSARGASASASAGGGGGGGSAAGKKGGNADAGLFWSDDGYKMVTKRVEDGATCLEIMARMVSERAVLERKHAQALRRWAKSWDTRLEAAPSFKDGTLHTAWRGLLAEGESTANIMEDLEKDLQKEVRETLLAWKKEHYAKSKLAKTISSNIEKARKPISKTKDDMVKKRTEYFRAAKEAHEIEQHKATAMQYQTPTSEADLAKLQVRLVKVSAERDAARNVYKEKHQAFNQATPAFQTTMKQAFQEGQEVEKKRIVFFRQILDKYTALVTQTTNQKLADADAELKRKISGINAENDLRAYAEKVKVAEVPAASEHKLDVWTPEEDEAERVRAANGSLTGAWFAMAAGLSARKFFVIDSANKQVHYYDKMNQGIPGGKKETISLSQIRTLRAGPGSMHLVQGAPERVWRLSVAPKDQGQVDVWSRKIAELTGLPIGSLADEWKPTAAVAPAVGAIASDSVTLTWKAPAATAGKVQHYQVFKAEDTNTPLYTGPKPTFTATKLTANAEHNFVIRTVYVYGTHMDVKVPAKTSAVTAVVPRAAAVTSDSVTLSWEKPPATSGAVKEYHVYKDPANGAPLYSGPKTTYQVPLLLPNTEHHFVVRTVYVSGATMDVKIAAKTSDTSVVAAKPPVVTSDSVTLTWEKPPASSGVVKEYHVYKEPDMNTPLYSGAKPTFAATGLKPDTAHTFVVRTVYASGATKDLKVPAKTGQTTAVAAKVGAVTADSVTLSWDKPPAASGAVKEYQVFKEPDTKTAVYTGAKPTCAVTGLAPAADHSFVVRTVYANGAFNDTKVSAKTDQTTAVAAKVGAVTADSVTLSWDKPPAASGAVKEYQVFKEPDTKTAVYTGAKPTCAVTGLAPAADHSFVVRTVYANGAFNDTKVSAKTAEASAGVPKAASVTSDSVTLTWPKPPAASGAVKEYVVYQTSATSAPLYTGSKPTFVVTGLKPETEYTFVVRVAFASGANADANVTATTEPQKFRKYNAKDKEAAVVIQKHFRGYQARQEVKAIKEGKPPKDKASPAKKTSSASASPAKKTSSASASPKK